MTILLFLIVLFVLVLVHEFGHFIVAKWAQMRVDEFGIGFPPRLFGVRRGETLYSFNALPIGGFVRIFGEDAIDAEASPDRERSFVAKTKWKQAAVLIAGVAMNVLFAWILFAIALSVGTQTAVSEAEASPDANLVISNVLEDSPADEAGLSAGSEIVGLRSGDDTLSDLTPSAFSAFISTHAGEEVTMQYRALGGVEEVTLAPEAGTISDSPDTPAIGVALGLIEVVSRPVHTALAEASVMTVTGLRDITIGISGLIYDALRFDADLSSVAGPVGIVGLVGEASAFGFTTLLLFTGFISLNLAIINMLPFPALDGGRLLFVGIEALKGSPIKPSIAHTLNAAGFILLILLMVAVTYNDILRII